MAYFIRWKYKWIYGSEILLRRILRENRNWGIINSWADLELCVDGLSLEHKLDHADTIAWRQLVAFTHVISKTTPQALLAVVLILFELFKAIFWGCGWKPWWRVALTPLPVKDCTIWRVTRRFNVVKNYLGKRLSGFPKYPFSLINSIGNSSSGGKISSSMG